MSKIVKLLAVLFGTAFLLTSPLVADPSQHAQQNACDSDIQEAVLIKAMNEAPDLFVAKLEGEKLGFFWDNMRKAGMLMGSPQYNKVYVFKSEHHPDLLYVFFLADGCIGDVKFTVKSLVERLLTD